MSVMESPVRVKGRGNVFRRWEQEIVSFFRKMHRKTGIDVTWVWFRLPVVQNPYAGSLSNRILHAIEWKGSLFIDSCVILLIYHCLM